LQVKVSIFSYTNKLTTFLSISSVNSLTRYTVSQKNDTDVAHYNFNAHRPTLVIFGRDIAETERVG